MQMKCTALVIKRLRPCSQIPQQSLRKYKNLSSSRDFCVVCISMKLGGEVITSMLMTNQMAVANIDNGPTSRGKNSLLRLTNPTAKHLTDFCCKLLFLFLLLLLLLIPLLHLRLTAVAQFAFGQVGKRWHRTCISMTIFPFAIFRLPRVQCSPVARDVQRYGNQICNLIRYR